MGGKRLKFQKRQKYRPPSKKEKIEIQEKPKEEDIQALIALMEKNKSNN